MVLNQSILEQCDSGANHETMLFQNHYSYFPPFAFEPPNFPIFHTPVTLILQNSEILSHNIQEENQVQVLSETENTPTDQPSESAAGYETSSAELITSDMKKTVKLLRHFFL